MKKFDNFKSNLMVLSKAHNENLENEFIISGIDTNIEFQNRILTNESYLKDEFDTSFLSEML